MSKPDLFPLSKKKHPFDVCECGSHMRVGADQCGQCRVQEKLRRKRQNAKLPYWLRESRPQAGYKRKKADKRRLTFDEMNGVVLGNTLPRH